MVIDKTYERPLSVLVPASHMPSESLLVGWCGYNLVPNVSDSNGGEEFVLTSSGQSTL